MNKYGTKVKTDPGEHTPIDCIPPLVGFKLVLIQ